METANKNQTVKGRIKLAGKEREPRRQNPAETKRQDEETKYRSPEFDKQL